MSAATRRYVAGGLVLRSTLDLPLAAAGHDDGGDHEVEVRVGPVVRGTGARPAGEVIASYGPDDRWWYVAVETDDGIVLRFRDCGELRYSADLDAIEVCADAAGHCELLPILVAGTGLALLLALRGRTVIHAGACVFDDQAVAIIGHSGHGKSTVAALLCTRGADLLSDDVLVVDPAPTPTALGGADELRLRPGSMTLASRIPAAVSERTVDGRLAVRMPRSIAAPLPLAGIIVPRPDRAGDTVEARRFTPTEAVFALLACPRVHGWTRDDVHRRDFARLVAIADEVPVIGISIPWGPPFRDEIVDRLAELARPPIATA